MTSTALASFNGAPSSSAENDNSQTAIEDCEEKMDEDDEGMGKIS